MAISNTLTAILPKILARGLLHLRSRVLMTRLVNLDYSMEAKKKGETIDVPVAASITSGAVAPAAYPAAPTNLTTATVQISLDNWQKASFGLTDKELGQINAQDDFITLEMTAAFEALAVDINDSIFAEYVGVYGYTGTADTTPFGAGVEVTSATLARKILNQQKCPRDNRRGVLDFDAEANALALAQFSDAEKVGGSDVKISGEIGRKFGVDWNADDGVPTHTAGTASGATTSSAGYAVGVTTMTLGSNGTGALVEGDVFTIAGDDQTYVISTGDDDVSNGGTIVFAPALKVEITTAETAITVKADHVSNLVFHRDAFALAMRAPDDALKEVFTPDNSYTMQDPVSGLVMRLEVIRMYKQTMWELDVLWGAKLIRAEYATRIAG